MKTVFTPWRPILAGIWMALIAFPLFSQSIQNGSVTGSPAANSGIQNGLAPPWSRCNFSPDLCDVGRPSYLTTSAVTPAPSPDGGTWLGVAALGECAETFIFGLTPGQSYTLYFCGANFGTGSSYNGVLAEPQITVGASVQSFSIPQAASVWTAYSMNFTANATTMMLQVTHPSGPNAYASLDGFNLTGNVCNPVILPAGIENFSATAQQCKVALDWSIPADYPATGFELQRSLDGQAFTTFRELPADGQLQYRSWDRFPEENGYYRLRILHEDGHVAMSKVLQVDGKCQSQHMELAPNPIEQGSTAQIKLFSEKDNASVRVFDLSGQLMYRADVQGKGGTWQTHDLPCAEWPAGVYQIVGSWGATQRLVIQ